MDQSGCFCQLYSSVPKQSFQTANLILTRHRHTSYNCTQMGFHISRESANQALPFGIQYKSLYISSKLVRNSSQRRQSMTLISVLSTIRKRLPVAFVPLYMIGREALPVSISEMDMPALKDVSVFPSCSVGTATPLAGLITSLCS